MPERRVPVERRCGRKSTVSGRHNPADLQALTLTHREPLFTRCAALVARRAEIYRIRWGEKEPGGALADGPDEGLSYCPGACGRVPRGDPRVWRTESSDGNVPLSPLSTGESQQSGVYVGVRGVASPPQDPQGAPRWARAIAQEDPRRRDHRQTRLLVEASHGASPVTGSYPLDVFGYEGVDRPTGGGCGSLVEAKIWAGPDGGFTTCSRPPAHAASTVRKPISAHTPTT
jgi:hypothetical protein